MIRGITDCLLCGKQFTGPAYALIGQGKQGDVIRYMNDVQQHFVKEHPEESEATQNRALEFLTMLRMMNFKSTDSELMEQVRFLRWQILQQVLPIRVRDEKLKGMAQQFAADVAQRILAKARAIIPGTALLKIPAVALSELATAITEDVAAKTVTVMTELRDLYEEPNRFNIEVVPVAKPPEPPADPQNTPKKPLLVLP